MHDPLYITLKYVVAAALILGFLVAIFFGRRRQNPFYIPWSVFLLTFGLFQVMDALNNQFGVFQRIEDGLPPVGNDTLLFRILNITQALAMIFLLAASLEQSMIVPPRASRIIAASLTILVLYFIVIPLENTLFSFGTLTISIYGTLITEFYGFIFGFIVICSALLLIPVFIRYVKLSVISKNKRIRWKTFITLLVFLMLIGLAFLMTIRRKVSENGMNENAFDFFEIIYSFVVVLLIVIYQSQSVSHGIETILVVDKEGNPLLGYSPFRKSRISFEEKIIAASGYLSGLFHFIQDYVATTDKEEFKEIKTTSSTLSFYSGEKIFLIIQTKISGNRLDKSANMTLTELDEFLADFEANKLPTEKQVDEMINLLEKNFYLIA
ncbi:MAG: hypothetical protein H7644_07145 [Candidatus Heimdallarchaeota archaeon]|nr:hypothetical protein [Candidatus Heimdallarchaeota archaeon]MCK5143525.1 hypothetical protein [Candidatus Heimdallarchaeota archaeon]